MLIDQLLSIQQLLTDQFNSTGELILEPSNEIFTSRGWSHQVWQSSKYRRAHIEIVNEINTKGLWMLHCCIYPHIHNPAPIFGFDIVAGRNKITGCFHDFSPAGNNDHEMIKWFENEVAELQWNKIRELPDWAKRIFSPYIIAASNVQTSSEITQIINTVNATSNYYLSHVAATNNTVNSTVIEQNYYAQNQKQNPQTPKVIAALGLNDQEVKTFIHQCLFPEILSA